MFDIILYNVLDQNNKVDKKLEDGLDITGNLRTESDVVHPSILIEHSLPMSHNYCYIPVWNRYYYIRDVRSVRNNIVELKLEVDVLMSFRSQIRNVPAIIDKQASLSNSNMYIDDGDWVVQNDEFIQIRELPSGFNNEGEFILIAAGGSGVIEQ